MASEVEAFFFGELVMSEGAAYACSAPAQTNSTDSEWWCSMRDVARLKELLLRAGLLLRAHGPQQVLRGQEALLKARMEAAAAGPAAAAGGSAGARSSGGEGTDGGEAGGRGDNHDGPNAYALDEDGDFTLLPEEQGSGDGQSPGVERGGAGNIGGGDSGAGAGAGTASTPMPSTQAATAGLAGVPTVEQAPGPSGATAPADASKKEDDAVLTAFTEFPMAS